MDKLGRQGEGINLCVTGGFLRVLAGWFLAHDDKVEGSIGGRKADSSMERPYTIFLLEYKYSYSYLI